MVHRRTLLAAAAAAPLAGCAIKHVGTQREFRVATFNIWHDAADWPARLPLILAALREADADIIALQEVLEDADKGLVNQARTIAASLGGYTYRFASPDAPGSRRRFGCALLTRLPVLENDDHRLEPLNDFRVALRLRIVAGELPIDAVCTHLAWQPDAGPIRARQLESLLGWLPAQNVPVVLMGDFNAPSTDEGLRPLAARFTNAPLPPRITTTLNPAKGHQPRVIDHIFFQRDAFVSSDAVLFGDRDANGVYPSDHFGVRATLRLLKGLARERV